MTVKYSVLVTASPAESVKVQQAIQFVEACVARGDIVDNVFFYMDGIHNANAYNSPMNDEFNAHTAWKSLAVQKQTALLVCITAAERRGVVDKTVAEANDLVGFNMELPFQQIGLGDFFERLHTVDKLVQF